MKIWQALLLTCVGAAIGFGGAMIRTPAPAYLQGERDVTLSDLNDLALMRHMRLLRDGYIADGRDIKRVNYSHFEDRTYAPNAWPKARDFLLLHPTASAGLYASYRMIQHNAQDPDAPITDRQRNWVTALLASAQHLALLENRNDLYDALRDTQLCVTPALSRRTWSDVADQCLPDLQAQAYRLLDIDPGYVVDNGSTAFLD